jgi:hypothetical protein
MNVMGIIKDAFLFPSKNTGRFAIYLLSYVLMVGFAIGGFLTNALGLFNAENYLLGGMYLIISMVIGFLLSGYNIRIIKSGIELDEKVPPFELYKNFMTGFDNTLVAIFYYIIPALIVVLAGFSTNLYSNATALGEEIILQILNVFIRGDSINVAVNSLSPNLTNLMGSLATTLIVALIVFLIFSIIQGMAEARLANTGSLREALNIYEALKDIKRIGVGKFALIVILIGILFVIIEILLLIAISYYPFLFIIVYIVLTPYQILVSQRAIGLLYSDIA